MDVTSRIYVGKTSTELTIKLVICGSEKAPKFVGSLPKFSETFPLLGSEPGKSLTIIQRSRKYWSGSYDLASDARPNFEPNSTMGKCAKLLDGRGDERAAVLGNALF